nr:FGGY family carbohydrate kinase [uncultured Acetatifactor sp.]
MKIIGIDIGTTSISIVLISLPEGTLLQAVTLPNDTFLPTAHPWERLQDPAAILAIVLPALDGLLSACSDVAAIGLTGQMHGIVYLNNAGSPVSPLFTWQDGRGNLTDYDNGKSVCSCMDDGYGIKLATGYGLATHLYNLKKGLVPTDAASFCTIADYVGMALTGRGAPLLHISQAASLGLYDSKANDFMRDIITENGIPLDFLPAVTKETVSLGSFRGIPASVSIGDNQASFMGAVGEDRDSVLVNIGTGSQISVLSHSFFQGKGIEARPFTADSYLLAGAALCGGSAYAALERFFREYAVAAGGADVPQYDIMKELLDGQGDPEESWSVHTTFLGTRENPDETGSVSGLRLDNFRPAALIRGVLNGMAEELYGLYRIVQSETALSPARLIASGNGVRKNGALQNILRNRFGMPLTIVAHQEEAAYGAALTAASLMKGNNSFFRL